MEKIKKDAEKAEDYPDADELFDTFLQAVNRKSLVCFIITTWGMACGPVASTIRIGIDMNLVPDEMDDEDSEGE